MPVSKARAAEIALRRSEMLTWKIMGRTPNQIAEHFGVSPGTARSDVSRAIKKARQLEVETAELYRFIQGSRLETLLRVLWPAATGMSGPLGQEGEIEVDLKAVEQVRKIITDINVLFGLNAPVRTEISGPDGGDIPSPAARPPRSKPSSPSPTATTPKSPDQPRRRPRRRRRGRRGGRGRPGRRGRR